MSQQPRTNTDVDTTTLLCFENNTQFMYCQLAIKSFDHINKIFNQNSHILKMKLILPLITLTAINSYYSISALKCYRCTDDENNSGFSMGNK